MATMKFRIEADHTADVIKELNEKIDVALTKCGIVAENYAVQEIENNPRRVDTGLLRNSITYALHGKSANKGSYHSDDNSKSGSYSGTADDSKNAVYIGSNVEYAAYVHYGTTRMTPNRFLENAMERHQEEYKNIIQSELSST